MTVSPPLFARRVETARPVTFEARPSLWMGRDYRGVLLARLSPAGGEASMGASLDETAWRSFGRAARAPTTRLVILTGTGGDFLIGGAAPSSGVALEALARVRVPILAAVEGRAHGLPEIALMADTVIAGASATFLRFTAADDRIEDIWAHRVGRAHARAILAAPFPVTATRALAWGAVDEMVSDGGALARAWALARHYLATSDAIRLRMRHHFIAPLRDALTDDWRGQSAQSAVRAPTPAAQLL